MAGAAAAVEGTDVLLTSEARAMEGKAGAGPGTATPSQGWALARLVKEPSETGSLCRNQLRVLLHCWVSAAGSVGKKVCRHNPDH